MMVALALMVVGSMPSMAGKSDFAIVIGNQIYRHSMPEVAFAKNDARAFAKAAIDVFGVPNANIIRLDDASLADFFRIFGVPGGGRGQIDNLTVSDDSRLYVYYSGHGMPVLSEGTARPYLMPVDGSATVAETTAYGLNDVIGAVTRVMKAKAPRGRAMVVVDACFSGSSDGGTLNPYTSSASVPAKIAPVTDVIVLAAAAESQVAHWDRERKKGLFTDSLLFGLYGAAVPGGAGKGDKRITLRDLDTYLKQRMSNRLRELKPGGAELQTPVLTGTPEAEIVHFKDVAPVYDAETRIAEESQCRFLSEFGEAAEIDSFLHSCTHCQCRSALAERKAKLAEPVRACEGERPIWARIQKSGQIEQVKWMATTARCGVIRAAAQAYLDRERKKLEEEQARRDKAEQLKPSLSTTDISARISHFIEFEFLQDHEHYGDRVDFYEKGVLGLDAIAAERRKYSERWPVRQYRLIPGTLVISRRSLNEYIATFSYTFHVANGSKRREGRGSTRLEMRDTGSEFLIFNVKEIVYR
jgi:hypothetical protein